MSYELKEKSGNRFFNGFQIAILLSLGLHLLVYRYGFPVLLFKEKSESREDIVSTIELTPSEQSRLPDLGSQWQVPQFNATSLDNSAPLALPLPPNSNLPRVPVPPGYRFPSIPNMSADIRLPPLGITDMSVLPLPPPLEDIDEALPNVPLTTPEAVEETPIETETEQPDTTPIPENSSETETKPTPEEIAAVREQKLTGDIRDISSSLQKQNTGTTNEDARKNYVAWLSRIEEVEPEAIEIVGTYPKDACIRRLEGASVYGVLVDSDREVVGLELIKGAEYPIFNEQASENIQQHEFTNDTEEIKPYQVTVNYEYDAEICPSLTLPSLRKQEDADSEKITPENDTEENQSETEETTPEETIENNTEENQSETEGETIENTTENSQLETNTELENTSESEAQPSLRERLQNTPLPSDDNIRERLRQNPPE